VKRKPDRRHIVGGQGYDECSFSGWPIVVHERCVRAEEAKKLDPEEFVFAKEKDQVLESLSESRSLPMRFKVFARHSYCDWFLQTACNYLEAYLSLSRYEMAMAVREKVRWGALGRAPTVERPVTPLSAYSKTARMKTECSKPGDSVLPKAATHRAWAHPENVAHLMEMDEEALTATHALERQGKTALKQLSTIYMQIMLDFSDFDKADEDNEFFELLFNFVSTVIRLVFGIRAQKQAEIELHRVFYDIFNQAARKYRKDPHVKDFGLRKVPLRNKLGCPYEMAQMRSPMMKLLLPTSKEGFMDKVLCSQYIALIFMTCIARDMDVQGTPQTN